MLRFEKRSNSLPPQHVIPSWRQNSAHRCSLFRRDRRGIGSAALQGYHGPHLICGKHSTLPLAPMYTNSTQRHPRIGSGSQLDQPITRDIERSPCMFTPTRHFFHPCCKHSTSSQSTLGPPLRGAWVALGPRLGHPRATQSQTQSPAESHRQRVAVPKCENPASSRVKITRVAQPPSAVRFNLFTLALSLFVQ